MSQESSDPDLNLQLLNDHGIYTIEEINELSRTVKPQTLIYSILCYSLKYKKLKTTFRTNVQSSRFDFMQV